jgi:hypothetical protein
MTAFLGADAQRDVSETGEACLAAAARALTALLEAGRFARDSALDLLAVDALATFSLEYASSRDAASVATLAARGSETFSRTLRSNG